MRPSPEPRSMTKSFSFTPASLSMSVTTLCGDGTYGPALTGLSSASALPASVAAASRRSAVLFMGNFRIVKPRTVTQSAIGEKGTARSGLDVLDDKLHALQPD